MDRAFVAPLIAVEKTVPRRRVATYGTAAILLGLGVLLLAPPGLVPALTQSVSVKAYGKESQ